MLMSSEITQTVSEVVSQKGQMGPPLGNANAVKHGLYRTSKDPNKNKRLRRRAQKRLAGVPSEMIPAIGESIIQMVAVEDVLSSLATDLAKTGMFNEKGEPRRTLTEYRLWVNTWLNVARENGMTLSSYMTTRKDSIHGDIMALKRWAEGDS